MKRETNAGWVLPSIEIDVLSIHVHLECGLTNAVDEVTNLRGQIQWPSGILELKTDQPHAFEHRHRLRRGLSWIPVTARLGLVEDAVMRCEHLGTGMSDVNAGIAFQIADEQSNLRFEQATPLHEAILIGSGEQQKNVMFVTIEERNPNEQFFPFRSGGDDVVDDGQCPFDLVNDELLRRFRDVVRGVLLRKGRGDHRHQMLKIVEILRRIPNKKARLNFVHGSEQHWRGPVPLGIDQEELLNQCGHRSVGIQLTDPRHEQRPGHSAEEAQCIAIETPFLRPEFDRAQRRLERFCTWNEIEDFVGHTAAVQTADTANVEIPKESIVFEIECRGHRRQRQTSEEHVELDAVESKLDHRGKGTFDRTQVAHFHLTTKEFDERSEEIRPTDVTRSNDQGINIPT